MNCYYCKGVDTIEEQAVRLCECEVPHPYIVENVPTFVCRRCGDKSFSGETLTALEKISQGEACASGVQSIQIFDFHQLNKATGHAAGRILYHAIEREFLKETPMIFYDKSLQWQLAAVQISEQRILDVQTHSGYEDIRQMATPQSHHLSGFSIIASIAPVDSQWGSKNQSC